MNKKVAEKGGGEFRQEHDFLGVRDVPSLAYYGIQTLRALENFPITGVRLSHYPNFIRAYGMVKRACARANAQMGLLDEAVASAIDQACDEVMANKLDDHFVVDVIQGGAGTSTNMNANEVIANRALEILGYPRGDYAHVHPNNHVNMSQSTNDTYPTAIRLAILLSYPSLVEAIAQLRDALREKGRMFTHIIKMGRTQLQDAVPMSLGQEFEAFSGAVDVEIARVQEAGALLCEVNLGATAIGTGINASPGYAQLATQELARVANMPLVLAPDLIEATSDTGAYVIFSSVLKSISVKLTKICNDLRLLNSGPRAGLAEIFLPAVQPGSTIMPGKVNPVIPEAVNQVAYQVMGNDLVVTMAASGGQLQLNAFEPIIVLNILQSIRILTQAIHMLRERCVEGIHANEKRCRKYVEMSPGLVTALNPYIGYENAARIVQLALDTERSVIDIVLEEKLLSLEEIQTILSPENMIYPTGSSQTSQNLGSPK